MPNGDKKQPIDFPYPIDPAKVPGFKMTPEVMFRDVQDAFPGHKQELLQTQTHYQNVAATHQQWQKKLDELRAEKTDYGFPIVGGLAQLARGRGNINAEIRQAELTVAKWEENEAVNFWKVNVLATVPNMFDVGMVKTADDILNYTARIESADGAVEERPLLPFNMRTAETRAFAERVMSSLREQSELRRTQAEGLLEKRAPGMVNVDDLTVSEILKALTTQAGPRLPEELRPVDLREVLSDLGYDTEELDAAMKDVRGQIQEQLVAWSEIMNGADQRIQTARSEMKLTPGERALQAFTQPALAVGSLFEEYSKRISRPYAYIGMHGLTWLQSKLGSDVAARQLYDMEAAYREAREEGFDSFGAWSYAYENWDTNWFLKVAGEVMFDPLTYADLGLGVGVINKLPRVGRLGRALGAFEDGYNRFCDAPIRGVSAISKKLLGRSTVGKASLRARQSGIYAIGAARQYSGVALNSEITANHILGAGLEAFARHLEYPTRLVDDMDKFGAELWNMTRKPFTKADLSDLITRLDGTAGITDDLQFDVTVLLDRTENLTAFPRPVIAKEIADLVGSTNYDEALRYLDELVLDQTEAVRGLLSGGTLKSLVDDIYGASLKDYTSRINAVSLQARREGAMSGMMKNAFQHVSSSRIVNGYSHWVDRMFVLPMARHVLLFSGYAPMNLVESCIRVSVKGYAPWRGWAKEVYSHRDLTASVLQGIDSAFVPQDIAQGEFAETFMEVSLKAAPKTGPETPTEVIARNIPGMTRPLPFAERIGFERGTMQNLNDWASKVASEHRAFTYREMFKRGLAFVDPDGVDNIARAVGRLSAKEFDSLSKKEVDGLQTMIEFMAMQSPDSVRQIAPNRELLSARKLLSDASDRLDELDQLDEYTKRAITDLIRTGDMTSDNVTDLMEEVIGATMDNHVAKLARSTYHIRKLGDDFAQWAPANKDEFLHMVDQLRELEQEVIPRAIEDANAAVTIRGRGILSNTEKAKLHKEAQKLMRDFMVESETTIKNMHARLKMFEDMLSPEQLESLNVRVRAWESRIRKLRTTREKSFGILNDYAAQPSRLKTTEGWRAAYAEVDAIWKSFWRQDGVDLAANEMFMRNLIPPRDVPRIADSVPAMQAGVTVDHVAQIFGVTPDQVTGNLVNPESATMMGRERFTNYVRGKAGAIAKETGLAEGVDDVLEAATKIGFTEDACDNVYNSILRRAGLDPDDLPQMGPTVSQLRGFGLTYRQLYDSRMIPTDDVAKLRAHIHEVADNLEQLPMYRRVDVETGGTPEGIHVSEIRNEVMPTYVDKYIYSGDTKIGHVGYKEPDAATAIRYGEEFRGVTEITDFFPQVDMMAEAIRPMMQNIYETIGEGNKFFATTLLEGGEQLLNDMVRKGHLRLLKGGLYQGDPRLYQIVSAPKRLYLPKKTITSGPTHEWTQARNAAAERATREYHQTFTDYSDESVFGAFMKKIYPFWTYESQRFPWLAQAYLRRPTLGLNMHRYMNYTDGGYIRLPGTDLQINPFRGTVFMGGMRRLWMKDFPEYYDAMPFASGTIDYLSRYGFYPGAHVGVPLAVLGTKVNSKTEWGEVLPPWARTALNFGAAMPSLPGDATQWFREKMFPDRFRTYMVAQRVIQLGGLGMDIYAKKEQNISLTHAEEQIWKKAERDIAWRGLLQEQTGMFRFRPEERDDAYQKAEQVMADILGVKVEMIRDIRRNYPVTGETVYDLFPMTSTQIAQVQEMEEYAKWNTGLITPLLPSEWRAEDTQRIRYYAEVDKIRERADVTGFPGFAQAYNFETGEAISAEIPISHQWLDEMLRSGRISGKTFDSLSAELFEKTSGAMEALSNLEEYKDVPKTSDERRIQRQERGRPSSTYHPETELRWLYYELTPKFDATTGEYDWDTFYASQHAILEAVPEPYRADFEAALMQRWTPARKQRWADYQNFMKPYYNVKYLVLENFTPEQVELIEEYRRAPESIRGREIRETAMFDADTKLVAHYDELLRVGHENMRIFDPELDGILRYWGKVQTSKTPEGEAEYVRILGERS